MLAITNAKVYPGSAPAWEKANIIIKHGKIVDIGPDVEVPAGAHVFDASGKVIIPGLVDANTRLGIHEDGLGQIGYDEDESTSPTTPQVRALDAINPEDLALQDALTAGVTTVLVNTGTANVIGGQNMVMKTWGSTVDEMVVKSPAGIRVSLTGSRDFRNPAASRDRTQAIYLFRAELQRAKEFIAKQAKAAEKAKEAGKEPEEENLNPRMEPLVKLLRGEIPAHMWVLASNDIRNALLLAQEYGFKVVLENGAEAQLMIDEIKASGFPVVTGPLMVNRTGELKNLSLKTPGLLTQAGIKVAIASDHPTIPIKYMIAQVALAVREGLTPDQGLQTVTINAAEILGVADRVGSLEAGKDADLVILSGEPFALATQVEATLIDGEIVYEQS